MKKPEGMMRVVIYLLFMVLTGCDAIDKLNRATEVGDRVIQLEAELIKTKSDFETLKSTFERHANATKSSHIFIFGQIDKLETLLPTKVHLEPSASGYGIATTTGGFFSISCKDVQSYSTGSKIFLQVVNFMSVTATNANLDLIYYEMSPVAILQKNENVAEALRKFDEEKKRVTITIDRLEPGRAKVVEIRIPEYKPEQLGYIEVGISFDGISFLGSTK